MKKSYLFRALLLAALVAGYLLIGSFPCVILRFVSFREGAFSQIAPGTKYIALLNGENLCTTCPSGRFLQDTIKAHPEILIMVPHEFSVNDIDNLRRAFGYQGIIINEKGTSDPVLTKIAACAANREAANNFFLSMTKNGRIKKAIKF